MITDFRIFGKLALLDSNARTRVQKSTTLQNCNNFEIFTVRLVLLLQLICSHKVLESISSKELN